MQGLYIGCIALSGLAMVAITVIIPSGVFMRYVMNDPLQWPEPASVIMMVFFSFVGGAAVYRANAQIAVEALMRARSARAAAHAMGRAQLHVHHRGVHAGLRCAPVLAYPRQHRRVPVAVGRGRLPADPARRPAPLLFLLEKIWLGEPPKSDVMYSDQVMETE